MANLRNRFPARRRFLKQSAALTAASASISPILALAQTPAGEDPSVSPSGDAAPSTTTARRDARSVRPTGSDHKS